MRKKGKMNRIYPDCEGLILIIFGQDLNYELIKSYMVKRSDHGGGARCKNTASFGRLSLSWKYCYFLFIMLTNTDLRFENSDLVYQVFKAISICIGYLG